MSSARAAREISKAIDHVFEPCCSHDYCVDCGCPLPRALTKSEVTNLIYKGIEVALAELQDQVSSQSLWLSPGELRRDIDSINRNFAAELAREATFAAQAARNTKQ